MKFFKVFWICIVLGFSQPVFINLHMPNDFFPNMTFVPYFKGFPTITHITHLDLPFGSFEFISIYVHFGISWWNSNVQDVSIQFTRPFSFHLISACFCSHHWAFHTLARAHASKIQIAIVAVYSSLYGLLIKPKAKYTKNRVATALLFIQRTG